jgi:hypothetical protein
MRPAGNPPSHERLAITSGNKRLHFSEEIKRRSGSGPDNSLIISSEKNAYFFLKK